MTFDEEEEAQRDINELIGQKKIKDTIQPDEFVCPENKLRVTLDYCQSFADNKGCKFMKICIAYKNKKDENK